MEAVANIRILSRFSHEFYFDVVSMWNQYSSLRLRVITSSWYIIPVTVFQTRNCLIWGYSYPHNCLNNNNRNQKLGDLGDRDVKVMFITSLIPLTLVWAPLPTSSDKFSVHVSNVGISLVHLLSLSGRFSSNKSGSHHIDDVLLNMTLDTNAPDTNLNQI